MADANIAAVHEYLRAIEENRSIADFYAADVIQTEFPNRLTQKETHRDLAALVESSARGRKIVSKQTYHVKNVVAQGETVVAEVLWTGTFAIPIGTLEPGAEMRAHFCMVLEFREGKIAKQRNYDCYEPF
jgi:ketosteroid isomerase-like protein